jgi:hypothetical protein
MTRLRPLTAALALSLLPVGGFAQTSPQADCAALATQQTGYDPAQPPPAANASAQVAGSGSRARGAAAGAVIGGASGDAGAGAAAGAVAGGVAQRSRNRQTARAQNETNAQRQSAYDQALQACLAQRGQGAP